ncbi:probable sodium/metabolite cotransporter BASS4, chloroplastic [Phoenix dactylifera]|uniref:Probable sodium/metabolite cotransporter BASS4, chloroplastic n=1 Tax=Phoenix dactylifera TaxID=42345 RepID=A0A8B9AR42_PHODC|nr:probable sodium/metabolite cotransporter BASS4, chloroplastic [Phoenix dactylifera]XP_026660205.1 probable sodium/metabolite cotransporter BASS4, chloroplastic [Phoenix dactylifera]XP_038989251.1 probable sodium/metabolite cotransporter BASS4, chloroplastic [Phoenix dactylifera]XP_038989252.1 probable sodium/metabolite cotransporter BASS4, chloroplastic [Phoenix dactylifera]
MVSSPSSLFSFSGKFLVAVAPPLLFGESIQVLRPLRAIGGSDQVSYSFFLAFPILLETPFSQGLSYKFSWVPQEFVAGLATSVTETFAPVQLSGGNDALTFSLTVKSNLLGIMMVPFSVSKYIGAGAGASVPTSQLFKSLITMLWSLSF